MNYSAVMEQINGGKIAPVYLLYGEETYLIHELAAEPCFCQTY